MDIEVLIEEYNDSKKVLQSAERMLELAKNEIDIIEARLIYYMQVNNISSIEYEGKIFSLNINILPNVLVKHHKKLKEFLGDEAKEVFSEKPSKLKSFFTKRFDKGEPIPDIVNLFFEEQIKVKEKK
jgi:hypothetical protein